MLFRLGIWGKACDHMPYMFVFTSPMRYGGLCKIPLVSMRDNQSDGCINRLTSFSQGFLRVLCCMKAVVSSVCNYLM